MAGIPGIQGPSSGGATNPFGTTAELGDTVKGVGPLLGLKWGPVTVDVALNGLKQLAAKAAGTGKDAQQARTLLASIQQDMWLAQFYGRGQPQPHYGSLNLADQKAFVQMAAGASGSGQDIGTYLQTQATDAQANGTGGSGTHIIPAQRVQQKIFTPADIQSAIDSATTPTGENLAQKLIGRDASQQDLQSIADALNNSTASQAQADSAGILAQQQSDIATSQAINGTPQAVPVVAGQPPGLGQFLAAVKQHETGGNYQATNTAGGVSGAYQYTQTTWSTVATQAGFGQYANGPASAAPPQVQDAVAAFDASQKYQQYGSWKNVAEAWYYPKWAGDPAHQNSVPDPYAGNTLTIGQYGNEIVSMMGQESPSTTAPPSAKTGFNQSGLNNVSPVGPGLKQGRTDQGVDFSGAGSLFAVGSGTILSTHNAGWPGKGTFIALKLDHPPDPQHSVVYYAEDINPGVQPGQHVRSGQVIGTANGGSSGVEIGWGDPVHLGQSLNASLHGSYVEGQATPEGQNFLSYIGGAASITGEAQGGSQGQTTDVYQQPIIDQVPATLDPTAAATQELETQHPTDYNSQKLLNLFQQIKTALGNPDPSVSPHVLNTPISMK